MCGVGRQEALRAAQGVTGEALIHCGWIGCLSALQTPGDSVVATFEKGVIYG